MKIMSGDFLEDEDIECFGKEDDEKMAAQDLIIKLTQMLPHMRLGSGQPGTPQSMEELKNHPWFTKFGYKATDDSAKRDVTRYYELAIPNWPKDYEMKYVSERLMKYY